ncbi:MAG: SurA N-terminal domain-containing protein, partial [Pseudomonadota bacterium]|nr:SurA N-terminal domain-containing protein [Pseudomonadota bacterium]
MKRFFLTLTLVTALGAASSAWAAAEKIDGIAAIVNDEAITQSELEAETKTVKAQLQQQQSAQPSDAVLQKQVLERLVLIHLKQQLASRNNIIIDDETLNRALSSIAKQNNMSLAQLRNIIERDGFDFNLYRENIRNEILHTRLR